jgi:hypothetical protein
MIIAVFFICNNVLAVELGDKTIKPSQNRVGIGNNPEITQPPIPKVASLIKNEISTNENNKKIYYDLDNKKIAQEIHDELAEEQETILQDLRVLWQAAAQNSETIKFAIYKLSKPDGEKIDENMVKKILAPIANIAPMIGYGSTNPIAASSSLLGGGMLSSILADDSAINNQLTRVTDSDLVILAKEIDDLQKRLVCLYYNYITTLKILSSSDKIVKNRYDYYNLVANKKSPNIAIADAFYRDALDKQYKARQELMSARSALEQFVGNEALTEVEKNIKARIIGI